MVLYSRMTNTEMFKLVDKTVAPDSVKVSHIMLAGKSEAETCLS